MNDIVKKRGIIKTLIITLFPKTHCAIDGHLFNPKTKRCGRCNKDIKPIKRIVDFYDALSIDLADSELKVMSKKHTKKQELAWMYDKGSMDTYKKMVDILEKENLIHKLDRD